MPNIVRVFNDDQNGPTAMDDNGNMFQITNMFRAGDETDSLEEASSIVIKVAEDIWLSMDVSDKTPWAERLN